MVRSSASRVVTCDNITKMLLAVTAKSNKWQQALGFVSCAQMSKGLATQNLEEKASVVQPEAEDEHNMVNTTYTNTSP